MDVPAFYRQRAVMGGFRRDIQGLRAVAVILVALDHARVPGLRGGYVGVDVFFVISGFLITGWLLRHSENGRIRFAAFYAARARRILPAACLAIVATAIASKLLLNYVDADRTYHDSLWAAFFAANIHFARVGTNYFAQSQPPSPLQHYWSLAVEEQFYLVWPAILGVLLMLKRRGVVFACVAALTAGSLAWSIIDTGRNATGAYFSSPARAWELGAGALLALVASQLELIPPRVATILVGAGLAAIVASAVSYSAATAFPGYAALLPVAGTAAMLAGGVRGATGLLELAPMRFTGDISYSFYLWHWPFLVIAAEHAGRQLSIGDNLLLLAAAYTLASLTFRFFENPLRHARALTKTSWRALTLWPATTGAAVAVALAGIATVPAATASVTGPTIVHVAQDPASTAIKQAVTARQEAKRIPSQLTPSPGALAGDFFPMKGCSAGPGSNATSKICRWGDTAGSKVMVVIGDSHAQMWLGPLTYFAAANGWQLIPLIKEGCAAGAWSSSRSPETAACRQWLAWALGEIQGLQPDAVVAGLAYTNPAYSDALNVAGATSFVNQIAGATSKLIVLQDVAHVDRYPAECILRHAATYGSCTFPLSPRDVGIQTSVSAAVTKAGATLMPTQQWFCSGSRCPIVVGTTILYVDPQHITPQYALALRAPLSDALLKLVG